MFIELSNKQNIYILLYQLCPNIDIIKLIYTKKIELEDIDIKSWYYTISPLYCNIDTKSWYNTISPLYCNIHNSNILPRITIDINNCNNRLIVPLQNKIPFIWNWYQMYGNILDELTITSHKYFLCKFNRSKKEINYTFNVKMMTHNEMYNNITKLINEPQEETTIFERIKIYKQYFNKLLINEFKYNDYYCCEECLKINCYKIIYNHYYDYINIKDNLYITPCGIDNNGELLYHI